MRFNDSPGLIEGLPMVSKHRLKYWYVRGEVIVTPKVVEVVLPINYWWVGGGVVGVVVMLSVVLGVCIECRKNSIKTVEKAKVPWKGYVYGGVDEDVYNITISHDA